MEKGINFLRAYNSSSSVESAKVGNIDFSFQVNNYYLDITRTILSDFYLFARK